MKTTMLVTALAVTLEGPCSRVSGGGGPDAATPVTYQLSVNLGSIAPPPDGLTVVIDGKPIGELSEKGKRAVPFAAPPDTMGVDLAPRIKARLATSCGDEDYPVRPHHATREEEKETREKYATPAGRSSITFYVVGLEEVLLYVDNVGGKAREMKVGSVAVALPADAPLEKRVRVGKCASGKTVSIDGKPIGDVSVVRKNPKSIPAALVDAVGGRCYRRVYKMYKEAGSSDLAGTPPPPEQLSGDRVYAIEHPTDFLVAAPKTFTKHFAPGDIAIPMDRRVELNRCEGTPKRGGALR